MLISLTSALMFGLADILAVRSVNRIGVAATVLSFQFFGFILLSIMISLAGGWTVLVDPKIEGLALAVGSAVFMLIGVASQVSALQHGTLAKVAPIASSYFAVSAILSLFVFSSAINPALVVVVLLSVYFLSFGSQHSNDLATGHSSPHRSIALAFIAMFSWGGGFFLLGLAAIQLSPLTAVWISRVVGLVAMIAVVSFSRSLQTSLGSMARNSFSAASYGISNSLGSILFSAASVMESPVIASTWASTYVLVPVMWGLTMRRERLTGTQYVAVAIIIGAGVLMNVT